MSATREELYEQVWSEAMTKVAARHGVSSVFLARVCERMGVPRPPRGYWAQLAVGKASTKPLLPDPRPGDELEWLREGESRRVARALPQVPAGDIMHPPRKRRQRPGQHDLLVGAREHFAVAKEMESGYLRPSKYLLVDLFVTKDTLDRALQLANELFLALDARGYRVTFPPTSEGLGWCSVDERAAGGPERYGHTRWRPARPTVVYIGSVAIGLTLFELSEEVEVGYRDGKYERIGPAVQTTGKGRSTPSPYLWTQQRHMPTGRLCLKAYSPYPHTDWEMQWRESKVGELKTLMPSVVRDLRTEAAGIPKMIETGMQEAETEREHWEAQRVVWAREAAERERVANIKTSREQLVGIIEDWSAARELQDFFEDIERRASALGNSERDAVRDRLIRARELAGAMDPLKRFQAWKAPEEQ
jgi:hypothetical protein